VHFHRSLRLRCERHHPGLYPKFKQWCDDYFVIAHRGNERRGVGGIFFDNLRPGDWGLDLDRLFAFATEVGRVLPEAYGPIVERRRGLAFGERERRLQLFRRGRYVEFNLLYDRGTVFGLQTGARADSVLMSLPPLASWDYAPTLGVGSLEAELMAMLVPRAWAD
jgi:coproporphyrinogen III oxidase